MGSSTQELLKALTGQDPDEAPQLLQGVYNGRVSRVAGPLLSFVIDDFSPTYEFGPIDYPRPAEFTAAASGHAHGLRTPATPPVGSEVIVAFVNGDINRPEVLKVKGWPS